jgi:phospholipase/lecithinase/hemolysin
MRPFRWLALALTVVALGLAPVTEAGEPRADLSRLVVVGDSLSAGFQNGSLHEDQQVHGYAKLVADQAGVDLVLPLIAAPGFPNVLMLVDPGPPPVIVEADGVSTGRVDPLVQPWNLAVPGARVADALATRPDLAFNDLTDLVLGLPGLFGGISRSQVEWAEALQPTTIIAWIGNMDALGAAIEGDASLLTPVGAFEASYTEILNRLAATGAKLIVGNIPDVTAIAFLTSAEDVADLVGLPLDVIGPPLGIGVGDFVLPDAVPLIGPILGGQASGPLPANLVLTAAEVALIQDAVVQYNEVIETQARAHRVPVVDVNRLLETARRRGLFVGPYRLTTDFLGGLFSLDGVHPTNTGYAIIANEFIEKLNRRYDAQIRRVNERQVLREDPLVFVDDQHGVNGYVDPNKARELRWLFRR